MSATARYKVRQMITTVITKTDEEINVPQLLKNKEPNGSWTTAATTSLMLISSANCFLKGEVWPTRDSGCLAGAVLYAFVL